MARAVIIGGTGAIGRAALGDGADLLVDCACFTAEDAARLLPLARDAASTVLISSKAGYLDAAGHHSNSPVKPGFGGPVREDQPTVAPGYGDYRGAEGYPAGKVAAEQVLLDSGALEISRAIARHLGHTWEEVLDDQQTTPGQPAPGQPAPGQPALGQPTLGRHPWDRPYPIVLDMTAATRLGYTPAGDYAATVATEVDWLIAAAQGGDDADLVPGPRDEYFAPLLDYRSENRWLAAQMADAG